MNEKFFVCNLNSLWRGENLSLQHDSSVMIFEVLTKCLPSGWIQSIYGFNRVTINCLLTSGEKKNKATASCDKWFSKKVINMCWILSATLHSNRQSKVNKNAET